MLRQALIAAGGKGKRLGSLAQVYGSKSLIPIAGKPIVCHVIDWLRVASVEEIIVTVNYATEYRIMRELLGGDPRVRVVANRFRKSSIQCLTPHSNLLDPCFFFIYGHAPVPPAHLMRMCSADQELVVSLYPTTSQGEEQKKAARLENGLAVFDSRGTLYVEPPHILTGEFVSLLTQASSWKEAFLKYAKPVAGVLAKHPPEFHYPADFEITKKFMEASLSSR